ncbi:MAG: hypothetical protein PF795_00735 [Kiritimatiellae bacterium]|jgi:hypothetical protein|nr:hypothetical protein [Kiritimatiellia bacterium]
MQALNKPRMSAAARKAFARRALKQKRERLNVLDGVVKAHERIERMGQQFHHRVTQDSRDLHRDVKRVEALITEHLRNEGLKVAARMAAFPGVSP